MPLTTLAPGKVNLCLLVGAPRADGLHPLVSVVQPTDLADEVSLEPADRDEVICPGVNGENLAMRALEAFRFATDWEITGLRLTIDKRVPIAAGMAGGSSDAAAALHLANDLLETPLPLEELDSIAASLGADVPFFLREGPQLATGAGTTLAAVALPRAYTVLLGLPDGARKSATADVYAAFDERRGEAGYEERRAHALATLDDLTAETDLAALPPNDLAWSPLADELRRLGAFRADVTGAGPVVYGLFVERTGAERARDVLGTDLAGSWIAEPR